MNSAHTSTDEFLLSSLGSVKQSIQKWTLMSQ